MKLLLNGQLVDEDTIAVVVPGFCTQYIFDITHFIPDSETNAPGYWQFRQDSNKAFAVGLKDGSRFVVARYKHDGEYEALSLYYSRLQIGTYQALYPELQEEKETQEQKEAAAKEAERERLRRELDF